MSQLPRPPDPHVQADTRRLTTHGSAAMGPHHAPRRGLWAASTRHTTPCAWLGGAVYEHLHDHHRWVLPEVLELQARRRADAAFLTVIGEGSLTYAAAAPRRARWPPTVRPRASRPVTP